MTDNPVLIETSFADAIAIILASDELSEQRKRHWTTSLRRIAKVWGKPLEVIPARYSAVRADLAQTARSTRRPDREDDAEPQEQREERFALAGA
jgi:hypothetical protein